MTAESPMEFYRFRPIHSLFGEQGTTEVVGDDGSCVEPVKPAKIGELASQSPNMIAGIRKS